MRCGDLQTNIMEKQEAKTFHSYKLVSKRIYFMGLSPMIFAFLILGVVMFLMFLILIHLIFLIPFMLGGVIYMLTKLAKQVKEGHPDLAYTFMTVRPGTKKRYYDKDCITKLLINDPKA